MPMHLTAADLKAALPDVTSPLSFSTLTSGATIRRDKWGIPHIKADNEYDLFFAQGLATAQDRLFQMDYDRMRCLGRLAEYTGASAVPQDTLMRRRRMERVSKLDYAMAGPEAKTALDAYADGVNAFIESIKENIGSLPVEYKLLDAKPERWEPWHCVVVYKVRNTAEGSFQGKLWLARLAAEIGPERAAQISPGYQPGSLLTVPPGERYSGPVLNAVDELRAVVEASSMLSDIDGGSNGWAISGDRTKSGLPLVAGDSHRILEAPNVYYQVHLIGPDFAVLGHSVPGVPMALHFCHNEHIGWGMTHGGVDTQDLFVEQFRERDGKTEYMYRDAWLQADVTSEVLRVRDAEDVHVRIVETHHGPVIAGGPSSGAAITLADPGSREGTPWLDAAYRVMKSRSADELEAAFSGWTDRVNNYPYADVHGNFGYTLRGRIPIRGGENGWGPVAGWTGEHEWRGYIPTDELPRSRNPETGWVVTCNQRVVDESYPHYLTNFYGSGFRAERIASRIAELAGQKWGVEEMSSIHADVVSVPALALQKALGRANGFDGKTGEAARLLAEWDCVLGVDSAAAALYEMVAAKLTETIVKGNYGSLAHNMLTSLDPGAEEHFRRHLKSAIVVAFESGDESLLQAGTSWEGVLAGSIERAIPELESRLGADWSAWRWGDLHGSAQNHPLSALFPEVADTLNPPRVETAGDGDTPFASASRTGTDFLTGSGPINRYIHDPSDWSNGRWIVPLGASGHPGSPHYADQQQMWAKVETVPQLWDWEQIGREAESEQRLTP
ncbi:MAG: penicillin acylase family protein [Chloroflexi bacterium]|nr:penicillin acylase family protein [Chloroflexota bacterium]